MNEDAVECSLSISPDQEVSLNAPTQLAPGRVGLDFPGLGDCCIRLQLDLSADAIWRPPQRNGISEKVANPAITLVELRGIAGGLGRQAQRSLAAPRTPDPQTARITEG